jgi:S-methylmethionine-dependent homocysteine/selenocysteine methylase
MRSITERFREERPVLLDGATGTELNNRGVDTPLPLWSTVALLDAPQILAQIHQDYVTAGAEIITANTFRTHERNLERGGLPGRSHELIQRAVTIARDVANEEAWVVGSQAPLEDCYSPELVPDNDALQREHDFIAKTLADSDVDLILVETQNTIREAVAASRAASQTGLPFIVSFVCGIDGGLLSGESLAEAARAVREFGPLALAVNCLPAATAVNVVPELIAIASDLSVGVYANIGRPDPIQGWVNDDSEQPAVYRNHAADCLGSGARLVGGCCGTTPEHIRQLAGLITEQTERSTQ